MTYREWVQKHGHIDHLVKGDLPHDGGKMTHKECIEKFGDKIKRVADELGVELTDHDLIEILDRIYGVPDVPFHGNHYDLHC
jgi:hypothetical protein